MKISHLSSFVALALCATRAVAVPPPNPTNSDASFNTAGGTNSQLNLTFGSQNTSFGFATLKSNLVGNYNTAIGTNAVTLATNSANTGVGAFSLAGLTSGTENTAVGDHALTSGNGSYNVALGGGAMQLVTGVGSYNVALGFAALVHSTGDGNIGIGAYGGQDLTTGTNNIDIGNSGVPAESNTTRLGNINTTRTFVGGISGVTISGGGSTVLINSSGQLGTVVSSARFKKDVANMGDESSKLLSLRPVTFHYKADPAQAKQYGLIAEEVAKVYPDLVVRSATGDIESVQYHELAPMLLNELQKQHAELAAMKSQRDRDVADMKSLKDALVSQQAVLTRLQEKVESPLRTASR